MKVLVSYRGIPQSPGWATGDMVAKALRGLGHVVYPYAKYYQQNKWVEDRSLGVNGYRVLGLDDHEFDLILYMECNDGDPQYSELAVARARKTVCWLFDTSYYPNRCKPLVDYFRFDQIFLANPLTIGEYKVWGYKNVHYLPYACDPELHSRPLSHPKVCDVALVGSIRSDRKLLADALAKHNVDLRLIGGVFREEYVDALASTRIIINQNPPEGRGLLNMRFFEAQAAGAFLLTEKADLDANTEISRHSPMASSYVDVEDLAKACKALLESPGPLDYLTGTRQNLMIANHTYQNRCKQLLEITFPHG
jgi:spore maturation protein CgeB